jgi:hypothetical protein
MNNRAYSVKMYLSIPRLLSVLVLLCLLTILSLSTVSAADLTAPAVQAVCDFTAIDEASLRQAIDGVNVASGGICTIRVVDFIRLTQPLPSIVNANLDELVIEGQWSIISAQGSGRVFDIQSVKQLTMRKIELMGGSIMSDVSRIEDWGGGLRLYCGENQQCAATLTNVNLTGNQAMEGGGFALYCAAGTTCSAKLIDSRLFANQATAGGAITTGFDEENIAFSLELLRTTVWGNRAEQGGGIRLRGGDFAAVDSTISGNHATSGGGIAMIAGSYILRAQLLGSTIFDNEATLQGGGLYIRSADPGDVQLTLANSTVSGNRVTDGAGLGGGVAMSATYGLQVDLVNATVANNSAATGAGLSFGLEEDSFAPATLVTLANSIIADNQGGSACATQLEKAPVKGTPLISSRGHNLDNDGTCLPSAIRQPSDLPNSNAGLAPLTDNGGATWSHALLPDSPAVDAGDDAICTAAPINGVDQRGDPRPQGPHCDIGAYERPNPQGCTYPNLVAADEAALRQAFTCVNVAGPGNYTITLAADITYSQPMLPLRNPVVGTVVVNGQGHTLDAQGNGRVLTLTSIPNLTLRSLTLTGGKVGGADFPANGGGIAFDCEDDVLCNWTLINTTIQDNQAESGGGIDYFCSPGGGGALVVQDSVIRGNRATSVGGGLFYSTDEDSQACSVTLRNTLVEGNQAEDGGGLRIVRPRVTISDSTIRNNRATQAGGGIMARVSDGYIDMTILRSTISGNQASVSGGGAYIDSPDQWFDIKFINSTFSGNRVENGSGGGLYLQETEGSLRIALINSTVTQNEASQGAGVQIFDRAEATAFYTSTLRLTNSIIANNQGSDCAGAAEPGIVFSGQRVLSFGHNLDSDGTCLTAEARQPSDLPSGTVHLGPLADNGGPTLTHALLPGSQAIDAGDDAVCADLLVNGVDQRGVPRFQGAHCDSGAYEALPLAPANTLRIQALIDGRSQLIVRGNTAQWHHFDWAAPGRHEFVKRSTVINDTLWFPVWPDQPDAENRDCNCTSDLFTAAGPLLPTDGTAIGLSLIRSRGSVQIVQFPDAGNDYTLIVEFDDSESGSDTYSIDLTWGRTALFVSSSSSGRAGAVQFRDEDIVAYDGTTNTWQMLFDGSDLGVTKDVDAFVFLADGSLLLSFNAPTDVPGLGKVDDSDIVQFTPTQLGSTTAGSFTLYLRGADVGLTTDGEDIDAIGFTADGNLVVSTIGDFAVTNLIGKDEDLIRLDDKTASVWSFLLDGSTVGLANEDVNGLWIDPVTGELYLTVKDSFAFGEGQATVPIDADDIFVCTPMGSGAITSCAYRLFWDSDGHDYGSENLNAIGLGVLPPSFVAAVQASSDASPTPEELAPDDDIDDLNLEESIHQLYLPLIEQ